MDFRYENENTKIRMLLYSPESTCVKLIVHDQSGIISICGSTHSGNGGGWWRWWGIKTRKRCFMLLCFSTNYNYICAHAESESEHSSIGGNVTDSLRHLIKKMRKQRKQISKIALSWCSLNVFVLVAVFLLVRSCFLISSHLVLHYIGVYL